MATRRAVEYKWFSQGIYNGSNNIYRYTVAAIVGVLATAAGSAAAGGLSVVAGMVISERWPAVYWRRETMLLMPLLLQPHKMQNKTHRIQ